MLEKTNLEVLGLFGLSHIYGITAGIILQDSVVAQGTAAVNSSPGSGINLFLMIGVATALMIGLYKLKMDRIIKGWYFSALFLTTLIFFMVFFPTGIAVGLAAAVFTIKYFTKDYWTRNVLDTFSYAGAGALFGTMLGVRPALIFIGVLALYDIVAVFFTKHMLSLVEGGLSTGTFMGIVYPKNGDFEDLSEDITDESSSDGTQIGVVGGGDIIVPMMFSISLLKLYGVTSALAASLGAAVGLAVLMDRAEKDTFYPAIPIVGGGAVIAWLLSLFII